jgi:hypothetical protein
MPGLFGRRYMIVTCRISKSKDNPATMFNCEPAEVEASIVTARQVHPTHGSRLTSCPVPYTRQTSAASPFEREQSIILTIAKLYTAEIKDLTKLFPK